VRDACTDRELEHAYRSLCGPVLRRVRRWFPTLSEADLEDVYQAAWLSIVRTSSDVRDMEDYVYAAVRSQGLMELRRRRRRPVVALTDLAASERGPCGASAAESFEDEPIDESAVTPEELAERQVMGAWVRDLLAELSPRQCSVVRLRWGWGLSRREIAGLLGISEKTVKRELEVSGRRLSKDVEELHSGRWCEHRRSVVTAYALEVLSPTRAERAEIHLRACPGCRRLVRELRRRVREVGALAPGPMLFETPVRGPLGSIGDVLDTVRAQFSDWVSGAKQQAVSLTVRASDPTPLAGARPGAVAAAVAGCLAVGTGAFCAVEGAVPQALRLGPLAQQKADADPVMSAPEPAAPHPDSPVPPAAPAPVEPQAPTPSPEPAPLAPTTPAVTPAPAPAPAPEPSQEFFAAEPTAPPVARAADAGRPAGAPAPAASRGEFGGP